MKRLEDSLLNKGVPPHAERALDDNCSVAWMIRAGRTNAIIFSHRAKRFVFIMVGCNDEGKCDTPEFNWKPGLSGRPPLLTAVVNRGIHLRSECKSASRVRVDRMDGTLDCRCNCELVYWQPERLKKHE